MKKRYFFCLLFISSNSFCNNMTTEASDQWESQKFDLGYCNPALDYCSSSFDFDLNDKAYNFEFIDKSDATKFVLSDPKGPNCLSVDSDSKSTIETVDFDCEMVLEVLKILAN